MGYDRSVAISKKPPALYVLMGAGSFSSPALANELDVSQPTMNRDMLFFKRQGFSIAATKPADGWAYQLTHKSDIVLTRKENRR